MNKLAAKLNKLHSLTRLLICFAIAMGVELITVHYNMGWPTGLLLSWSTFAFLMILLSWTTFTTIPDIDLYMETRQQDESGPAIFLIVVFSVCLSLAGILLLRKNVSGTALHKELHQLISILSLVCSWILLHTIFTLHYARIFYSDDPSGKNAQLAGLRFPEEEKPDYLDFAYFSFVIGMTFQVSDVDITSRLLRKIVLAHGLISFVFNTVIVALTISILSGLN